jgi:prefoldin alpha subunit
MKEEKNKKETKKLQEKYAEFQLVNQQIQQLQEQLNNIWQQVQELNKLDESLKEIQKVKKGSKILIPLGASIYFEGSIEDTSKAVMGVGAGVCVKKNTEDACKLVEEQMKELNDIENQLSQRLNHIISYAQKLQSEMSGLVKEQKE